MGDVCTGNGAYIMFRERQVQWFCSEEQFAANADGTPPWGLEPSETTHWDEYKEVCTKDEDCPHPELGQACQDHYWDATENGSSFVGGNGCFNYKYDTCPGPDFASINYNYENTKWAYYG